MYDLRELLHPHDFKFNVSEINRRNLIRMVLFSNTYPRSIGGGVELVYAHAEFFYLYSQLPLESQRIEFLRTGFILGARIFLGIQVPLIPSVLLQLRSGYSLIPEEKLAGNVKSANLEEPVGAMEPIDPGVFIVNNKYALSQLWLTFGMAYFF